MLMAHFQNCTSQLMKDCHISFPKLQPNCFRSKEGNWNKLESGNQLIFPEWIWKRDIDNSPSTVAVSFLMQYFKRPENLPAIIERLHSCTTGQVGNGLIPGLTTELIVNVDEPSNVSLWKKMWKGTKEGRFLVPVFSHDIQEVRGYNRIAHLAQGKLFILLQDDEIPPESCVWLARAVAVFETFPNIGMLGMRRSQMRVDPDCKGCNNDDRPAWERWNLPFFEPNLGIQMHFASVVDSSPSVYRKKSYFEVGLQDEALMGGKGESGIYTDWEMAMRHWLAGYSVALMSMDWETEAFKNPPGQEGGTHSGIQGYFRQRNMFIMMEYWSYEEDRIFEEVKRLNSELLVKFWPWFLESF